MVRPRLPPPRGRARGKLTSDPVIQDAGVAVTFGLDPLWFLGLGQDDLPFAVAALNTAIERRDRERRDELDYLADRIAARTTTGFATVMRGFIRAITPRR